MKKERSRRKVEKETVIAKETKKEGRAKSKINADLLYIAHMYLESYRKKNETSEMSQCKRKKKQRKQETGYRKKERNGLTEDGKEETMAEIVLTFPFFSCTFSLSLSSYTYIVNFLPFLPY